MAENKRKIINTNSLQNRMWSGSKWISVGAGGEQFFRLIRNMILTRILLPEAFAEIAIVLSVNVLFEALTEVGIKEAIIQNQEGKEVTFLNSSFFFAISRAILIYFVSYMIAPAIGNFYQNTKMILMLRLVFLGIVFNGMVSPNAYIALKEMQYKKWILIDNLSKVLGIFFTIILVSIIKNTMALVFGFLCEYGLRLIFSYIVCPFLPSLKFRKKHMLDLFKFAKGVIGLPFLTTIFLRADIFILGKMVSASDLGMYSMAVALARAPTFMLNKILAPILLPSFSSIQHDLDRINKLLIKLLILLFSIAIPSSLFVFLFGGNLLELIYGKVYYQIRLPFAIIFLSLLLRSISVPISTIYFSLGKPELQRTFVLIRTVLVLAILYPLIKRHGTVGSAIAVFVSIFISTIFQISVLRKVTGIMIKVMLKPILYILLVSSVIYIYHLLLYILNVYGFFPRVISSFSLTIILIGFFIYRFNKNKLI